MSKYQISSGMENERSDARRVGRTGLARSNSQARPGTGKHCLPGSADHKQDCQPYLVDARLLNVITTHTSILHSVQLL